MQFVFHESDVHEVEGLMVKNELGADSFGLLEQRSQARHSRDKKTRNSKPIFINNYIWISTIRGPYHQMLLL